MTENTATALLRPGHAERVLSGHPWVYESSIKRFTRDPEDGEVVQVRDSRKRFLGIGFYNSRCRVRIRMAAAQRIPIDQRYFEERITRAREFRDRHLPQVECCRVVNAEADFLGGLIVDRYKDTLAIQINSLAFDQRSELILQALKSVFPDHRIVQSHDSGHRKFEGLPELQQAPKSFEVEKDRTILINQLKFEVQFGSGHKTGAYLDQQFNYQEVGELTRCMAAKRILDCFTYQGGFALHAAQFGATEVVALDQSAEAIAQASRNAELNQCSDRVQFQQANVFDWLKSATQGADGPAKFDHVILDPPSFTRSRSNLSSAARGYKEIHLRALRLLKAGGLLSTFSCSHHADRDFFLAVIREAAADARRQLRLVRLHHQPIDHPVLASVPETEYLKGFTFEAG